MSFDAPYLGLSGVAGAGKDTVHARLVALGGARFVRLSVADPLKDAAVALLGCSHDQLEEWKRDGSVGVQLVHEHRGGLDGPMSIRLFLQKLGTQVGREIFGESFWLDLWERKAQEIHEQRRNAVIVNTSVRFENEAQRILDLGGEVWHIDGPQDPGAGTHESEQRLPDELITRVIDNTVRGEIQHIDPDGNLQGSEPDFQHLDDQIASILHQ